MGWRGICLGLILALIIAGLTLFNDTVMKQPLMTGNTMPTTVYGVLAILAALSGGHLLRLRWVQRLLSPTDLLWLVILATAACAWPGWGFFHPFPGLTANIINLAQTRPSWQARQVLSYLPGGSPLLPEGMLQNADALWQRLAHPQPQAPDAWLVQEVRRHLQDIDPWALQSPPEDPAGHLSRRQWNLLLRALNQTIELADLPALAPPAVLEKLEPDAARLLADRTPGNIHRLNRMILAQLWPEHVLPIPPGEGVILAGGQSTPGVTDTLLTGTLTLEQSWLKAVPWKAWWPVLRLWVGVAMLIALASVCLALIVHPQWSRSEQLPYPLTRLVLALIDRGDDPALAAAGGGQPVFRQKLFWIGAAAVLVLHLLNGLHAWYPQFFLWIPLSYNFRPLVNVWPALGQVWGWGSVFTPTIFISVVAFAFFVRTDVSLSVGISQVTWVLTAATLLTWGIPMQNDQSQSHAGPLFRAGAYVGTAIMILYFGRNYYASLAMEALGLRSAAPQRRAAVWAARLLVVCLVGAAGLLYRYAGLEWWLGLLLVGLVLLMLLVLARITAESGLFYIQPNWLPATLLVPLFGLEGLGATTFVLLVMASVVLAGDPRESIMAYLVNALNMADRSGRISPPRAARWQALVVVLSGIVAAVATLLVVYHYGITILDGWAHTGLPAQTFNRITHELTLAWTGQTLPQAVHVRGLEHWWQMTPDGRSLFIIALGIGLTLTFAWASLRIPRWPIHPVIFTVIGTTPVERLAWSFLIGWAIKTTAIRLGGERLYVRMIPLMIGLIAGEVTAALLWQIAGISRYLITGIAPPRYAILPW